MSMTSVACTEKRVARGVSLADVAALTKPKIGLLVLATVAVAALTASSDWPSPVLLLHTLLGTALIAASASALNQWFEYRSDAAMQRTADRPIPAGRLVRRDVLVVGVASAIAATTYLALAVNLPTAMLGLLTWTLYVWVYTPLKSRTPANTVVGALAGAIPVWMGYTCVAAPLDFQAFALFAVVFLWQFPHFMAIAWMYRDDYAAGRMQMLTVVDPSGRRAGRLAVVTAAALVPVGVLPVLGTPEPLFIASALALGLAQWACSVVFWIRTDRRHARWLLRASLVYLPGLLALLVVIPLLR